MRLGELKNILDYATDENDKIIYSVENLYGGQLFRVKNFQSLLTALKNLSTMEWVTADTDIVSSLAKSKRGKAYTVELSPEEHSKLTAVIDHINGQIGLLYGILRSVVEEQEETILNVKIPEKSLGDLKDLNKFNTELQSALDFIVKYKGLRGDTKFKGFDVGTSWYEILIVGGPLVYAALLKAVKIAEDMIKLRKGWYESEEVRLNVEIKKEALAKDKAVTIARKDIEEHVDALFEKRLAKEVALLIENLPDQNINNANEMQISVSKGVHKLIDLMEKGTEFHPSLNPPEYVETYQHSYTLDYEKLREVLDKQVAPEQIEHRPATKNKTEGAGDAT